MEKLSQIQQDLMKKTELACDINSTITMAIDFFNQSVSSDSIASVQHVLENQLNILTECLELLKKIEENEN